MRGLLALIAIGVVRLREPGAHRERDSAVGRRPSSRGGARWFTNPFQGSGAPFMRAVGSSLNDRRIIMSSAIRCHCDDPCPPACAERVSCQFVFTAQPFEPTLLLWSCVLDSFNFRFFRKHIRTNA